ncbi:MAG: GxxExxY protein [Dehalococcoidia bacterium]|nr:GxxExxY protein [Dehalococcoidia bacterium]
MAKDAPLKDITYKVIGVAIGIHNELGPGHPEEVYQRALEVKLPGADLSYEGQRPVQILLDETRLALYYLDFLVEERVIVEIKARSERMGRKDQWQVMKYFAATGYPVALWINFGPGRLEYHRLFPPRTITNHRKMKRLGDK